MVKMKSDRKTAVQYKNKIDYILNLIGLVVGFSNVWRFPYICYKNGGGSFLLAYATFIVVLIFPILVIESGIGQFTGRSAVKVWYVIPLLRGIGYAGPILMFYYNIYCPVLISWTVRWLVASFSSDMPWTKCDNAWNTKLCLPLSIDTGNQTMNKELAMNSSDQMWTTLNKNDTVYKSSVEEFWNRYLLNITEGIEDIGGIKPDLLACLAVVWILAYFSIWKGIQWTSRIVYFTATFPIALLIVVLVRGATLEGAGEGLRAYLQPNITKLGEYEVWNDAANQVLFSLAVSSGAIISLSQFNKFNHNFYRDSIILAIANGMASFLAGLATFSILGYLAHAKNATIEDVADAGPGLVFIVYPTALSLLPFPNFWLATFFAMLILLGFDSLFVYVETFIYCMKDQFPQLFRFKWGNEIVAAGVVFITFLLGLPIVTNGGMYVLNIYNSYSAAGWCIYFLSFCELVAIGWFYDADRFLDNIKTMLGFNVPRLYYKICWKYIGPVVAAILMIYSLASYRPLTYGKSYVYPLWADLFGWMTALNSVLTVPFTAIYVLYRADGSDLRTKFKNATRRRDVGERVADNDQRKEAEFEMEREKITNV